MVVRRVVVIAHHGDTPFQQFINLMSLIDYGRLLHQLISTEPDLNVISKYGIV